MKRIGYTRLIAFLLILGFSVFSVIPTIFDLDEKESNFPVKSKVNLGLDLQGGLYMVLGIDFNKVYQDELKNNIRKAVDFLKKEGIEASEGQFNDANPSDPKYGIKIENASKVEAAASKIKEFYSYPLRLTGEGSDTLEYGLGLSYSDEIKKNAVSESIEVIRNRIDEFGVTEPEIVSQGEDRIVVQLPGVKDIAKAKSLIGRTARLELKMVNDEISPGKLREWMDKLTKSGVTYEKYGSFSRYVEAANKSLREDLPKGFELAFEKIVNKINNQVTIGAPYLVQDVAPISGDDLQDARVSIDPQANRPYVSLNMKPRGARIFDKLTAESVGKRMAIIMDSNVYSAPVINERIPNGSAQITLGQGDYNQNLNEAKDLALVLRAGALPVELEFQEQRIVGPSLGADSINNAKIGGIIACILVFLLMIFYYKVAGVIAVVTLIVNVAIILACLVGFEATLTLPGIAGIVLTVGMAVDANIIIYERIKEEIAAGAPNIQAVDSGFGRAFWTILDANITTALAGLCLINFGTGPIRGFAVTLLIGIAATIYTSYFLGRMLFDIYVSKTEGKSLKI